MMKKKRLQLACAALALCAAVLSGCASGGADTSKKPKVSGNAVTVNSMEQLLEAFKPGAEIVLAKGNYNLTNYINDFWLADEAESFNVEHQYVEIVDCYDGVELVVKYADNVTLRGEGETAETEIVIDPRYGTVLTFEKCDNLKVSNLTMGHTEMGECMGSVLELSACDGAELRNLDLYGCGVIALECSNNTQNVTVYDSALRDCSWGPLDVYSATGKVELHNCSLTGSDSGGFYNSENRLELAFYNCTFGQAETNYWMFTEGVTFEDCAWSEIDQYPDYEEDMYQIEGGPREIVFDADALSVTSFDSISVAEVWCGYATGNPEAGTPSGISAGEVSMSLRSDATGILYGYYDDYAVPFLWEKNKENPAKVDITTLHHGALQATVYQAQSDAVSPGTWLSLTTPEGALWMYLNV
ncbi:MAG: hypothetical protein IJR72_01805 [Oscillospiraceae bacterium]|nr:hypothetical protein [Oscillospiraceae bacterium]